MAGRTRTANGGLAGRAVAASLILHGALLAAWVLRRPEPQPPPLPAVDVLLAPEPAANSPEVTASEPNTSEPAAKAVRPRPAQAASAASPLTSAPAVAPAPAAAPLAPSPGSVPGALRSALAARLGCRNPDRLDPESRRHCEDQLAATPEVAVKSEPYFRMQEHVAVMAKVRRTENTGYRASCEAVRNLDPSCPNALPDNLPRDFELPKD